MYQGKFERTSTPSEKQQGPRLGGLIFYTVFFLCLLLFWLGVYLGLTALDVWLSNYQAAQPDTVCQAVFDALFADPDWGALYDRAGLESGAFESRDTFISAMEEKVGRRPLTCMETSTGLSLDRKYIVRLDGEKLAAFTLTDQAASEEGASLPNWQLGKLEFYIQGSEDYTITCPEGCRVLVNGRELDDSYLISRRSTLAGAYLPVGVSPKAEYTYRITGLLTAPEVTVQSGSGELLTVSADEAAHSFCALSAKAEISQEEKDTALNAVKTYALYMIKKAGASDLAKYFSTSSDTYRAITGVELSFVQDAAKREFAEETVTDYCRYTDDLFSVRVGVTLNLTRANGTVKENRVEQSLFFSRNEKGKWLCYAMTAVDISEMTEEVRLTFRDGETVLQSVFYAASTESIQCPTVQVPEGRIFTGWAAEEEDAAGSKILRLVFQPDSAGNVSLPAETVLTPMTLYPLFE